MSRGRSQTPRPEVAPPQVEARGQSWLALAPGGVEPAEELLGRLLAGSGVDRSQDARSLRRCMIARLFLNSWFVGSATVVSPLMHLRLVCRTRRAVVAATEGSTTRQQDPDHPCDPTRPQAPPVVADAMGAPPLDGSPVRLVEVTSAWSAGRWHKDPGCARMGLATVPVTRPIRVSVSCRQSMRGDRWDPRSLPYRGRPSHPGHQLPNWARLLLNPASESNSDCHRLGEIRIHHRQLVLYL